MRDQYVGDIGDFVKYGLLRAIREGKCLGVAWYLCAGPGPTKKGDGGFTGYLQQPEKWRHLDPKLFDELKRLVDGGKRSVSEVQESGILGDAVFADEPVDDVIGVPVPDRKCWRHKWFERVKDKLSHCDLVFADPDNGLYPDERFRPTRKVNAKRIPLCEAMDLAEGRTAVIYHHNNMDGTFLWLKRRVWRPRGRAGSRRPPTRLSRCQMTCLTRCWSNVSTSGETATTVAG